MPAVNDFNSKASSAFRLQAEAYLEALQLMREPVFDLDMSLTESASDSEEDTYYFQDVFLDSEPEEELATEAEMTLTLESEEEEEAFDQFNPLTWSHEQHLTFVRHVRALNIVRVEQGLPVYSIYPTHDGQLQLRDQLILQPGWL